ncbi:MAG: hypothetical protein PHY92_09710 [Alphaproteobacteria bacterium]|nr:hypothetical protein [Alphaproteobacteria bacterium]
MTDTPLLTLTDKAVIRLQALAEGNGLMPESIKLLESEEKVYTVEGLLSLAPQVEIQARSYAGPIRGKDRVALPGFAALQEEVNRRKKTFQESADWLPEALKELQETPGYGWGHDGGKIAFPERKVTLAASEKCPACLGAGQLTCDQCQGRTVIICPYCYGRGQENCYNCFGKGTDPVNPQQPCPICRGTRFAPCRYCKATGNLPCPNCQGRGGTPCPTCKSTGFLTQEADVDANASLHFAIKKGAPLPSGLLRSLDRLGMANLVKGHGDIEFVAPVPDVSGTLKNTIILRARIPYADIKLQMSGKVVIAAAFGKRGLMSGIPSFLDESLKPWREHLARAAEGTESLDKALEARALREALDLKLSGKDLVNDLRRLYPIGLSSKTAGEILDHMEKALRRITLRERLIVAVLSLFLSAALFTGLFLTPLHAAITKNLTPRFVLLVESLLPAAAIGLSGFAFVHAAKWVLQRRYPRSDVRLTQSIGRIGYGTLAGILVIYVIAYLLAKNL